VLLADAIRLGDERFAVAAVWHRDHYLTHHDGPAADPVLLAETARQAAIHLSHRFFDVAYGMPFVLNEISVDLSETLPPVGSQPLAVGLDIVCRRPDRGARRLRLALEGDVLVRHRSVGRVRVSWEPMEPRRYDLVRWRGTRGPAQPASWPEPPPASLPPAQVGHRAEADVLICADPVRPNSWWLRLDPKHPVLFDHESDHVPGMALVEAFRQAGRVAAADSRPGASGVTLVDVAFQAFGEPEVPVSITAKPATPGGRCYTLHAHQGERELARATVACGAARLGTASLDAAC
jgi:hypothetical protein